MPVVVNNTTNPITNVPNWTINDVETWLRRESFDETVIKKLCTENRLNGRSLLALNDHDFTVAPLTTLKLGDRKCLYLACRSLQKSNAQFLLDLGVYPLVPSTTSTSPPAANHVQSIDLLTCFNNNGSSIDFDHQIGIRLPAEKTKAFLSFCYVVAVTWITAFVMVIVHDRVPDMKKYPPLPDIFLDNVPHIPWAFDMCEVTGTLLFTVWLIVLLFHKHRFILMRRFFALSGTVFLLRCITMLITSLSVPGAHLQCRPRAASNYTSAATNFSIFNDLAGKLSQAFIIWRGAGMSIQGVRTCGDYMFSGHTVALTMLNFFITEYTPRHIYYVHTISWMMNMFGIFFILAAHEHYSIDVFVAFYITSRLFLYYHTLSNNQALMQRDSTRTKVWFPLFSYFESSVDGIVPNEYQTPHEIVTDLFRCVHDVCADLKDTLVLTTKTNNTTRPTLKTFKKRN